MSNDSFSLHMLAYLRYGSETSKDHLVVIGDSAQKYNYMGLYGLTEKEANKITLKKGRRKAKQISQMCSTYNFNNIQIKFLRDLIKEDITDEVREIFQKDKIFKNDLYSLIPKRIRKKAGESNLEIISQYPITEISMALALGRTRISHPRQEEIDSLTQKIQEKYGVGSKIDFDYPDLGLEYEIKGSKVEPYSSLDPKRRIILGENINQFKEKIKKSDSKTIKQLKETWNKNPENINEFYKEILEPFNRYIKLEPLRKLVMVGSIIGFLLGAHIIGEIKNTQMKEDYVTMNYKDFEGKYETQLPPMFTGCFDLIYGDRFPKNN